MFSVIDSESFRQLNSKKISNGGHKNVFKRKPIETNRIVLGSKVRSKTGCTTCRQRK